MNRTARDERGQAGVTLPELMLVVTLLAILAIVAVPNYARYSLRAHRTEAKSALLKLSTNEERYYLQHHAYTLNAADLGFTSSKSENGTYTLAITTSGGLTNDYTATAAPTPGGGTNGVNMTGDMRCSSFSIDSSGARTASSDDCW